MAWIDSGMKRSECHQQVWRYIGEPQEPGQQGSVGPADVNNWLQSAQYKVRNDLPEEYTLEGFKLDTATVFASQDANTTSFNLPTDYFSFETLTLYPTGISGTMYIATYRNRKQFDHEKVNAYSSQRQTTEGGYYCTALRGLMLMTPAFTGSLRQARLEYLPKPVFPATDNAYLDVPEIGEELVCLWIAVQGAAKQGNVNLAESLRNQYNQRLMELGVQGLTDRQQKVFPAGTEAAGLRQGGR
jgi:hypothetical protein